MKTETNPVHSPKISRMLEDIPASLSLLVLAVTIVVFGVLAVVLLVLPSPAGDAGCMGGYLFDALF